VGTRLVSAYICVGVLATIVYFALPPGPQAVLYVAIGVSAVVAIVAGARRHLRRGRLPWYLFALGLLLQAAGDATFSFYELVLDAFPEHASLADVAYLAGYPALVTGVALLIRRIGLSSARHSVLDAAIVTAAFALVQWVFLMQPLATSADLRLLDRAVWLAYPAMDLLLLAALARFLVTPAWRAASYRYLVASGVLLLAADEFYGLAITPYVSGSWLDAFWLLSYVAWGAAALHPSMRDLSLAPDVARPTLSWRRVLALAIALLAAPAILAFERLTDRTVDALALAVGGSVLAGLILARVVVVVRGIEQLSSAERRARDEAETAQRQISEQNERLRELDRLKDEFVASISHDLRTPLTSIAGYVELLREDEASLSAEHRHFLNVVSRNAERLMSLVDDLLFVARLQSGQVELSPDDLDLGELAGECLEAARPRADGKDVELDLLTRGPLSARGDRRRLAQVLDNLVSNAIKFTPEGGRVEIRVGTEADQALLEVSDTGIGISEADRQRLFTPFFRAPEAVVRQIPGTGLGLHIAREIVTAHGGTISVDSRKGGGTTFAVALPLAREPERLAA
jgi:signal transduction histidine kinase